MKKLISLEEASLFALSIFFFHQTQFAWWWYLLLILIPDFSMLGYLAGSKTGAFTYNLVHHKAVAIIILCLGWYVASQWAELTGIILLGHSSLDRVFGYGLKYMDSFHHTHLGWLKPDNSLKENYNRSQQL